MFTPAFYIPFHNRAGSWQHMSQAASLQHHLMEVHNASQPELYERFKALHERPNGFVMPNAWDGVGRASQGSRLRGARDFVGGHRPALGRLDGRHTITREEHIENASCSSAQRASHQRRLRGRLRDSPKDVAATVEASIAAGLAGIGIEDTSGNPDKPIRDFDDAVASVREAAKVAKGRILLTGRTDNYLHGRPDLEERSSACGVRRGRRRRALRALSDGHGPRREMVKAVAPKPLNLVVGTMTRATLRRRAEGWREAHQHRRRAVPARHGRPAQCRDRTLSGDLRRDREKPSTSSAIAFGPTAREDGSSDRRCLNARVYFWLDFTRLSRQGARLGAAACTPWPPTNRSVSVGRHSPSRALMCSQAKSQAGPELTAVRGCDP